MKSILQFAIFNFRAEENHVRGKFICERGNFPLQNNFSTRDRAIAWSCICTNAAVALNNLFQRRMYMRRKSRRAPSRRRAATGRGRKTRSGAKARGKRAGARGGASRRARGSERSSMRASGREDVRNMRDTNSRPTSRDRSHRDIDRYELDAPSRRSAGRAILGRRSNRGNRISRREAQYS